MKKIGTVYLVGAGPGAEDLITLRALSLLKSADVVIYDNLSSASLLFECREDCEKIFAGKIAGHKCNSQDEINALLCQKAKEGKMVVRLKGGDPFVFGRGGEEAAALEKEGIAYCVVPGVTSAISAAECEGIPVTHRNVARSFRVITAHGSSCLDEAYFSQFAKNEEETLVFLMGVSSLENISKGLIAGGMKSDTPCSIVESGTTIKSRRIDATLETLVLRAKEECVSSPAVVVVGKTAALNFKSSAFSLSGKKIGITGTSQIVEKQRKAFFETGAQILSGAFMKINVDEKVIEDVFRFGFSDVDWIFFTSSSAVNLFFDAFEASEYDLRSLFDVKFAVVGGETAKTLRKRGFKADFVPKTANSESLSKEFVQKFGKIAKNVIALRAEGGSKEMNAVFEAENIQFKDFCIYRTKADSDLLSLFAKSSDVLDFVAFSSSSAVRAFFDYCRETKIDGLKESAKAVCIGKATFETCAKEIGEKRCILAKNCTAESMVDAVLQNSF